MFDIEAIKEFLAPHFDSLKIFNFTYDNPLFWAGLIVLFIVLSMFWTKGSSFSFSFLIGAILLGTTKIESLIAGMLVAENGAAFDPLLIRIFSGFVIAIIFVYYAFMKEA
jgi:hypothetical protein